MNITFHKQLLCIIFFSFAIFLSNCSSDKSGSSSTKGSAPVVVTGDVSNITATSATCSGEVTADGGNPIIERGFCWSTEFNPTISDNKVTQDAGLGSFTGEITGLKGNTIYYIRAFATNSEGTRYGGQQRIYTDYDAKSIPKGGVIYNSNVSYGSVKDIDGNTYKTISLGSQTWMAENLKVTRLNDGTPIRLIDDGSRWVEYREPLYGMYDNEASNVSMYGKYYNFFAIKTNKLCPAGWRVPSTDEWDTLIEFLGKDEAGIKLKETGTHNWIKHFPIQLATNESGFTALPGGTIDAEGQSAGMGYSSFFATSNRVDAYTVYNYGITYNSSNFNKSRTGKYYGVSVRCVKD